MLMVLPNQAGSLQGSRCVSSDILTANDPGTGSGWQQSKQNWALPAVVGYWARMQCSDPCCVQGARLHPYSNCGSRCPAARAPLPTAPGTHDSLAEWSKALASGASPQGRGFEPHSCHFRWQCPRPPRRAYATARTARHRRRNCWAEALMEIARMTSKTQHLLTGRLLGS